MNKKTIKIAGWALGLSMAVAGIGVAVVTASAIPAFEAQAAVPANSSLVYTLDPVTGSDQGYATSEDIAIGGITWNVTGNSTMTPWRIGGKNLSGINRSIYSKTAISSNISYIAIKVGAASSVTVNSMKVGVYSTAQLAEAGGDGDIATFTPTFVASSTIEITKQDSTSWAGCFYNITFNVTIGSSNKYIAFEEAKFYSQTIPLTGISNVSLSKNTAPANYTKGDIIATAAYAPDGSANEAIVWTSSDDSIATIAAGNAYNTAVITPVAPGTVHFTASNQAGTITRDSGDFVVTEAVVHEYYQITFAEQATDSTTAFANATAAEAKLRGDTDVVGIDSASNVFSGAGDSFKFGTGNNQGSITFTTDEDVKTIIVQAKAYGSDSTKIIPKLAKGESSSAKAAVSLTSDYKYYAFSYDSAGNEFTLEANAAKSNRFYVKSITFVLSGYANAQGAFEFATKLLNDTAAGCAAKNASTLATAWSTLSTAYDTTESSYSGAKAYFKAADGDEGGTLVEQAAARYDYIVGKYLKTLSNPSFTDFADRDPSPINGLNSANYGNKLAQTDNFATFIAIIGTVGLATTGGFFFISHKRHKEE